MAKSPPLHCIISAELGEYLKTAEEEEDFDCGKKLQVVEKRK